MSTVAYSQVGCGTIQTAEFAEELRKNKANWNKTINRGQMPRFVPITIHRVGDGGGDGKINEEKCYQAICLLNERYALAGVNMFFYLKQFNEINSETLHTNPRRAGGIINSAKDRSSLNVFCVGDIINPNNPNAPGTTLGYYAPGVQNDFVVMQNSSMGDSGYTLEHELGHFFTLRHTHYGWEDNSVTPNGSGYDASGNALGVCPDSYPENEKIMITSIGSSQTPGMTTVELVDGSNCETAGDEICDTPADYGTGFCCGCCTMRWTILDRNCDTLAPMLNNIMGYAGSCSTWEFSPDQVVAMETSFDADNRAYLRNDDVVNYEPITADVALVFPIGFEKVEVYDNIELQWEPVPGAEIYYVTVEDEIFQTTENSLTVTWLGPNDPLVTWKVDAFSKFGGGCFSGAGDVFSTGDQETSAVNDISFVDDVAIYPNPISKNQNINVSFDSSKAFKADVRIMDITGKTVYTAQNVSFSSGQAQYAIPTNGMNNGIYILELATEEGAITEKLIID